MHQHIQDVCRKFAKLGHLAIASELYYRQGDVSNFKDYREIIGKVVSKVPDAQVMSDLDATAAWASLNHGLTSKMGGLLASAGVAGSHGCTLRTIHSSGQEWRGMVSWKENQVS